MAAPALRLPAPSEEGSSASAPPSTDEVVKRAVPDGPSSIAGGLINGAGSIAAGFASGAAALVVGPVVGAKQGGVTGAAVGFGAGVVGAFALPVVGAVGAVGEVVAGAANTPSYIKAGREGLEWDEHTQTYVCYSLPDEYNRLRAVNVHAEFADDDKKKAEDASTAAGGEGAGSEGHKVPGTVATTKMYDVLGVSPQANGTELRKAYYRTSLRLHPDKNPDDPEAGRKFEQAAQAYQVLSDPDLRARYDARGDEGVAEAQSVDANAAKMMFSMLFGSEEFEQLIGQAPTLAEMGVERKMSDRERRFRQQLRTAEVATSLAERLHTYVEGKLDGVTFATDSARFAEGLTRTAFGLRVLHLVGSCYVRFADEYLASLSASSMPKAAALSLSSKAHAVTTHVSALSSVLSAASAELAKKEAEAVAMAEEAAAKAEATEADAPDLEPGPVPSTKRAAAKVAAAGVANAVIEVLWHMLVIDVESTLKHAAHKLLYDRSVTEKARLCRARAMRVLGCIYRATSCAVRSDEIEVALTQGGDGLMLERTLEGGLRLGAVGGPSASSGLAPGDSIVAIDGVRVIGYSHARRVAPHLFAAANAIAAAPTTADSGDVSAANAPAAPPTITLVVSRLIPEDGSTRTWREHLTQQMGMGAGSDNEAEGDGASGRAAVDASRDETDGRSWAEAAGRHGSGGYQFGDVTRSALCALKSVQQAARDWTGRTASLHAALADADKAGLLGKQSDVVKQWRRRWFAIKDDMLIWATSNCAAPHGWRSVRGLTVGTDDFAAGQPFSIVLTDAKQPHTPPLLLLAADSLRERDAWIEALSLAAGYDLVPSL